MHIVVRLVKAYLTSGHGPLTECKVMPASNQREPDPDVDRCGGNIFSDITPVLPLSLYGHMLTCGLLHVQAYIM